MPALTIGRGVRKSPFYDSSISHGACLFTANKRTFMQTNYESEPEVEYAKLLDGIQNRDVACERQGRIAGPDTTRLA